MFFLSLTEDTAIFSFHGIELNRKTYHLGPINTLLVPGSLVEQKPIRKIFWIPGFERRSCPIFQSHPILSKGGQQLLNLVGCSSWSVVFFVFFGQPKRRVVALMTRHPRAAEIPQGFALRKRQRDASPTLRCDQIRGHNSGKIGSQGWGWVETWIKRPYYL